MRKTTSFFPGGSAPRPPFSRPSASKMSAFGLQMGPRAPTDPPKWIPQNGSPNGTQMGPKQNWVPKWNLFGFILGTHFCLGTHFEGSIQGDRSGPWDPFLRDPFRGIGWGPGTHLEAEGRLNGGLGAEPPEKWGPFGGPVFRAIFSFGFDAKVTRPPMARPRVTLILE